MPLSEKAQKEISEAEKRLKRFPSFKLIIDSDIYMVVIDDLNTAAYLKILKYEIVDVRPKGDGRSIDIYFRCIDQENPAESTCQDIVDFYNNRGVAGRYNDYINARGDLVTMLKRFK